MKKFNEIEQLSAYLDDLLNESDSKRLQARLESDVEFASVLSDLSLARNILRLFPKRKSPRNFTLTRKMVGLKPPLPRTYPLFRLATIFATLLLVFSFSINALSPYVSFSAPQSVFGFGGGGGSAMAEEPMMMESAPADAQLPESTETARIAEAESETSTEDSIEGLAPQPKVQSEAVFPSSWVILFLVLSTIGGLSLFFMRYSAKQKWR